MTATEPTFVQRIAGITNNLSLQVPLGVLFLTHTPRLPMVGIEAPDGWRWFDPPFTASAHSIRSSVPGDDAQYSLGPLLTDLSYLQERGFVRCTYKVLAEGIAVLRVYCIPADVEGNRFLTEFRDGFRRGQSHSWHEGRYRSVMRRLLGVMDFSKQHWEMADDRFHGRVHLLHCLRPLKKFHARDIGAVNYIEDENWDHHITRLLNNETFSVSPKPEHQSLEARLTEVYNNVSFSLDPTSEYLSESQQIRGLKSTLYTYQTESVAKMLMNESTEKHNLMPHIIAVKRRDKQVYFNLTSLRFTIGPELYTSPRGGILAENMGLGKTLICLALICLTKDEQSVPPDQFSARDFRDHKVLPLMEQCARFINRRSIPWKKHIDDLPESCVRALKRSPGYFYLKKEEAASRRFLSRGRPLVREEKLLLTGATLVVCPDNLFHQWLTEIDKHVHPSTLEVCKIISAHSQLPTASELSQFDVVLLSVSEFVAQNPKTSTLTKVYWKRFIIDEGHSMHQRSTRAVEMSKEIKVERRWAVTGTPTAGMTKLHMNETADKEEGKYVVKRSFNARDDLSRFGALVYNFFQIEPWRSQHDLWMKSLVKPFVENRYGATRSLVGLVSDLIVRHTVEQIEDDVLLPPLIHNPVFLSPSFHNKLSVNLFVAVLAVNAVSSEREDKDYMFHPASKVDLRRLVTNLQRATFYWTGFSVEDLESMMYISQLCLDKKKEDGSKYYNDEDTALLHRCIQTCKLALADQLWRTVSTIHEMTYYITSLPSLYTGNFSIGKWQSIAVLGAPQVYAMQKFHYKNRFTTTEERVLGYTETFWKDYWQESQKKNAERLKRNDGQPVDVQRVNREIDHQEKIALTSPKKMKRGGVFDLDVTESGKIDVSSNGTPEPRESAKLARILGTGSAKLSYMVAKLLENQFMGVKSIVFFEFEDSAYYLSEALDLLGLDYTLYATSVAKNQRAQSIDHFNTAVGGHALIMDLKLASHGLTITAATRVFFLNPVWKRSVEAQAIKRAHRIGQTSPVYVETLVLRGTLEEEMFRRRHQAESDDQAPVADDGQIQRYISKFEFLHIGEKAPYSEIKGMRTSGLKKNINVKTFEEEELCEPMATVTKERLHWFVPVFSKQSQQKITEAASKTEQRIHTITKVIDVDEYDFEKKKNKRSSSPMSDTTLTARSTPVTNPSFMDTEEKDEKLPRSKKVRFA